MAGTRPIGVFDSGTGGLSVLRALRDALPREDFVYYDDSGYGPYGERDEGFVVQRTLAIGTLLQARGVRALVVACNTATAAAVEVLRATCPDLPVIGVEPALKPAAALTRTGRIGVIATRGTLASARFARLQAMVGEHLQVVPQPCEGLAAAIDALAQQPSGESLTTVEALCRRYLAAMGPFGAQPGAIDTLVLGCTHYVLVRPLLQQLAGPAVRLVDTGEAVARQTVRRLDLQAAAASDGMAPSGPLTLLTSGDTQRLARAAHHWLGFTPPPAPHPRAPGTASPTH